MNAARLWAEQIEVLARAPEPMTTSAARVALTERARGRGRLVVAEEVYRASLILQRQDLVRRVHDQPVRLAHWELTHNCQPEVSR